METDTTQREISELNGAANVVRNIAIQRFERGYHVQALNAIADAILGAMHLVASQPTPKGAKMEDETPKDDRAVLKPDQPVNNRFVVGKLEETVTILGITPRRFTKDEALNLAAWLIAIADEPIAFEHVNSYGAVLSVEFVELLRSVQNT